MNEPKLDAWELLAMLLTEMGEHDKTLAKLWETDPEKYGSGDTGAIEQRAQGSALKRAADLVRRTAQGQREARDGD